MWSARFGSLYRRKKRAADGTQKVLLTWWIKYRNHGEIVRESSHSEDREEAERLLKKRLGEIATGRFAGLGPERIRVRDLVTLVVEDYEQNERATLADVKRRAKLHILPTLGKIRAADLGTARIRRYIAERRREGAASATINRELAVVKRGFRLAFQNDAPLVARMPYIPIQGEKNVRTGFVDHNHYLKLRSELSEAVRPLLVIGYYTGARIGEIRDLRWEQVDFSANRITLHPGTTKNDEGRTLPIYGEMRQFLVIEKEIRDSWYPECQHVFRRGRKPLRNFRKIRATASERAGVSGLLFHDLRRTAVRNMIRAGIPEKIAMQISGRKTRSVFDRYNIVSDRDLDLAAERMERHIEKLGTLLGTPDDISGDARVRSDCASPRKAN